MATDLEAPTTPEARLERLESVVCRFIAERLSGRLDPWAKLIENPQAELQSLVADLGARYAACTLTGYSVYDARQRSVLDRLTDFAERIPELCRDGSGLMLLGKPGTGKDHLIAAILKIAVAKHKLDVSWRDGMQLFVDARKAIRDDRETEFVAALSKGHILCISDPQPPKGDLSDYQTQLIRMVVDRRYRRNLSTWLTTNLDNRTTAEDLLSGPVMDRLREGSGQVFCDWESFRERKEAKW